MESGRGCPSFDAGFDASDLLSSEAARVVCSRGCCDERGAAARVLRRRCRSEGLERSPYDDACSHPHAARVPRPQLKSHFTINKPDVCREQYLHISSFPALNGILNEFPVTNPENGDYLMAHEQNLNCRYSPTRSPKFRKQSPKKSVLVANMLASKLDEGRLPKVEELLDLEMMDFSSFEPIEKQPLRSIHNNPLPCTPPGILKKPKLKSATDGKAVEGRRRQRALSETEYLYCRFGSPTQQFDSYIAPRTTAALANLKRAKDNSGSGYSYGVPSVNNTQMPGKQPGSAKLLNGNTCKEEAQKTMKDQKLASPKVLKTTAINNLALDNVEKILKRPVSPAISYPIVSPEAPVSSLLTAPAVKKTVRTRKIKVKTKTATKASLRNKKLENTGGDDLDSGPPSPDIVVVDCCPMETEVVVTEPLRPRLRNRSPSRRHGELGDQASVQSLSAKLTNGAIVSPKPKESPLHVPLSLNSCVRRSLFPRVPPFLKFVGHEDSPLKPPLALQKHLKWKLTTITPIVVKKTLLNSGFKLVKSECDTSECPQEETVEWIGIWGKHMKSLMFRAIKDGQKMNHFPGTFQIGRKDRLWRNLQKLVARHGMKEFGIMPKTYVLPHDMKMLKHDWEKYAARNEKWIIKPPASARGTGIKVVSRWTQIPKKRAVVVQKYVAKPYLINGSKFDLRLYVLVTSMHPLRIYLYKDGLARFASVKYTDDLCSLHDRYIHLTNYSINRLSKNYTQNEDAAACQGHKWTIQTLMQYLKTERQVDTEALWKSMEDLVIKTILSGEASISSLTKANITSRYNCYELFGIDVLLDQELKPWLLEVNISPSLHSASPLDLHVKGPLVTAVLNIAQYQIPVKTNVEGLAKDKFSHKMVGLPYDSRLFTIYLSKEERDKHIIYTKMENRDEYLKDILSTLTPDDVRHLIQSEDELTQTVDGMTRIFPTSQTHKYLNFLSGPRYYNRLFDAWETRYKHNRSAGIELLRSLCDIGYHLEVPPVPFKRAPAELVCALDGCRMTWTRRRRMPRSGPACSRWSYAPRLARSVPRRARPPRRTAHSSSRSPRPPHHSDTPTDEEITTLRAQEDQPTAMDRSDTICLHAEDQDRIQSAGHRAMMEESQQQVPNVEQSATRGEVDRADQPSPMDGLDTSYCNAEHLQQIWHAEQPTSMEELKIMAEQQQQIRHADRPMTNVEPQLVTMDTIIKHHQNGCNPNSETKQPLHVTDANSAMR